MIVRESINFERGIDPKQAMGLGTYEKIREWMDEVGVGIKNFSVNQDFSINTQMKIIAIQRKELFPNGSFPPYIRFNTSGSFDIDDCEIDSLIGCPKHVMGYFSCQSNNITSLEGFPKKVDADVYCFGNIKGFSEEEIRQVCDAQNVEADDSDL